MSIGYNIKSQRNKLGMTLEEVASKLDVSRQTLSRYETGVISNIPSDKIETLAAVLHTSPSSLMGWDEKKPTTVSDDGLWASICEDKTKLMLARWISSLNTDQLEMVVGLLEATRLTPEK